LLAFDDNYYPPGNTGLQQEIAVTRQARAIARAHGGFATGGSTTDRSFLRSPGQMGPPPVLRRNPGASPPIPPIPEITLPPPGDLTLTPDMQPLQPPQLDDLDKLPWSEQAYDTTSGPIPAQLTALAHARDDNDWNERLLRVVPGHHA
jgi:hypothetical protein